MSNPSHSSCNLRLEMTLYDLFCCVNELRQLQEELTEADIIQLKTVLKPLTTMQVKLKNTSGL